MKTTHNDIYQDQAELENIVSILTMKNKLSEKTRINLYLPKVIVRLMDSLAGKQSRGGFVSSLIVREVTKNRKLPYGLFSPLEISEKEIKKISGKLEKKVHDFI